MKNKIRFQDIVLFFCFIIPLFVISNETAEKLSFGLIVPHFVTALPLQLIVYWIFATVIIANLFIQTRNSSKIRLDPLGTFLVYRVVASVVHVATAIFCGTEDIKFGNYSLVVWELIVYFGIMKDSKNSFISSKKIYESILLFVCALVSIELILQMGTVVLPRVSYTNLWYKACTQLPIGDSNALATIILPIFGFLIFENNKSKLSKLLIVLSFISIILTKSRTGIILMLFCIIYRVYKMAESKSKKRLIRITVYTVLIIPILFYFLSKNFSDIIIVFQGYSSIVTDGGVINGLSSGRFINYSVYLESIFKHPLFGCGPNYIHSRAHMIFIDILYQDGLVGLIQFIYVIYWLFKKGKKNSSTKPMKVYLVLIIVNSLLEISIFTNQILDLMFFMGIKIYLDQARKENPNTQLLL